MLIGVHFYGKVFSEDVSVERVKGIWGLFNDITEFQVDVRGISLRDFRRFGEIVRKHRFVEVPFGDLIVREITEDEYRLRVPDCHKQSNYYIVYMEARRFAEFSEIVEVWEEERCDPESVPFSESEREKGNSHDIEFFDEVEEVTVTVPIVEQPGVSLAINVPLGVPEGFCSEVPEGVKIQLDYKRVEVDTSPCREKEFRMVDLSHRKTKWKEGTATGPCSVTSLCVSSTGSLSGSYFLTEVVTALKVSNPGIEVVVDSKKHSGVLRHRDKLKYHVVKGIECLDSAYLRYLARLRTIWVIC